MQKLENKKKLMFVKGDDYYYLTYNILIVLDALECYNSSKKFVDYRKLSFLIEFVANSTLNKLLKEYPDMNIINPSDKSSLERSYSEGMVRLNQVMKLIFFLEKKDVLTLERAAKGKTINLWLNKDKIPTDYFDNKIFSNEYNNVHFLKSQFPRLRINTLKSLLDNLFNNYGIKLWRV